MENLKIGSIKLTRKEELINLNNQLELFKNYNNFNYSETIQKEIKSIEKKINKLEKQKYQSLKTICVIVESKLNSLPINHLKIK